MPTTINGIGTHYYGKRNPTTHYGVCNQCHRELLLTDYETRLWFCVIFIPIIPLGKKQIVNQCPGCTYHYAVPLKNWQKQGDDAVASASESLAENTSDPAKAIEMHATLSGFHRHEESGDLAKVLLAKFSDNSDVLFYLASWHEHFTRFKEADDLFVKAADIAPADVDKQAAAVFALARQHEFDASLKKMETLKPPAIPGRPDLVRHVARQLAVNGRAADAYRLLSQLLKESPELRNRQDVQREVRPLEWQLGVKQSLVPSEAIWRRPIARWFALAATIIFAVVAVEGWNLFVMQNEPIHAINGVNAPVEFSIDGGPVKTIPPLGRISFTLPQGKHRVTLLSRKLPGADPFDFEVKQAWHERFFSKPAFVIDASRTSVLLHRTARYSQVPFPGDADVYDFRFGDPFTQFAHIDHRFEELPEQIEGNSSGVVYRTQLSLVNVDPLYLIDRAPAKLDAIIAMQKRRLTADPSDSAALQQFAAMLISAEKSTELAEFVRTRIRDNPPLLAWHRIYQNLASDRQALVEEYDKMLATNPKSAAYLYLRGRICDESSIAIDYFDRALAIDPQFIQAYLAKAHESQSRGQYEQAADLLKDAWDKLHAAQLDPASASQTAYFAEQISADWLNALFSSGNYEEFDRVELQLRQTAPHQQPNQLVYLSKLRQGKLEEVRQIRERNAAQIASLPQSERLVRGSLKLTNAVLDGDLNAMREAASLMPEPPQKQLLNAIAFDDGSDPDCKAVLGVSNEFLPIARELLTSLRCRERGEPFEAFRDQAIEYMKTGASTSPAMLALFNKSPAATIDDVDKISLQDRERGILLVALAYENPPQKEPMLRYARRLLTIPRLPQKCLDDWIKQGLGE